MSCESCRSYSQCYAVKELSLSGRDAASLSIYIPLLPTLLHHTTSYTSFLHRIESQLHCPACRTRRRPVMLVIRLLAVPSNHKQALQKALR